MTWLMSWSGKTDFGLISRRYKNNGNINWWISGKGGCVTINHITKSAQEYAWEIPGHGRKILTICQIRSTEKRLLESYETEKYTRSRLMTWYTVVLLERFLTQEWNWLACCLLTKKDNLHIIVFLGTVREKALVTDSSVRWSFRILFGAQMLSHKDLHRGHTQLRYAPHNLSK